MYWPTSVGIRNDCQDIAGKKIRGPKVVNICNRNIINEIFVSLGISQSIPIITSIIPRNITKLSNDSICKLAIVTEYSSFTKFSAGDKDNILIIPNQKKTIKSDILDSICK